MQRNLSPQNRSQGSKIREHRNNGSFSFFPSKNLGAAGDAGMIVTNDEKLYERMSMMRSHGAKPSTITSTLVGISAWVRYKPLFFW